MQLLFPINNFSLMFFFRPVIESTSRNSLSLIKSPYLYILTQVLKESLMGNYSIQVQSAMSFHVTTFLILILFTDFYQSSIYDGYQKAKSYESTNRHEKLNCTTKFTPEIIQMIVDYASWRRISLLYIVDSSINLGNVCFEFANKV